MERRNIMNKIMKVREKIVNASYAKFFKRFLSIAVAFVLRGGGGIGFALRSQISQTAEYLHGMEHHHMEEHMMESLPIAKIGDGMEAAIGIYAALCVLILVIFWLAVAAWMYKKAVQFNMNGLFWLIVGLVTNVVGVAALFIVRSALYEKCPSCGTWQKKRNLFCTACGAEWKRTCSACGELCAAEDAYCRKCGHQLKAEQEEESAEKKEEE